MVEQGKVNCLRMDSARTQHSCVDDGRMETVLTFDMYVPVNCDFDMYQYVNPFLTYQLNFLI